MKCEIETKFGDVFRIDVKSMRFIDQSDIMGIMLSDGRKMFVDTKQKSFRFKDDDGGTYYSEFWFCE